MPDEHEFKSSLAKEVLTDARTRATYLNKLGQNTIHRFALKQQEESLTKCLTEFSKPGYIFSKYSEEAYDADVNEAEAQRAEKGFELVARHLQDDFPFTMPREFIKLLPLLFRVAKMSSPQLFTGLSLFVACNGATPQLPAIAGGLIWVHKKKNVDCSALLRVIVDKMAEHMDECVADVPLTMEVADQVLNQLHKQYETSMANSRWSQLRGKVSNVSMVKKMLWT